MTTLTKEQQLITEELATATKPSAGREPNGRGLGWASPVSNGRPSLIHRGNPPSRMRTFSTR